VSVCTGGTSMPSVLSTDLYTFDADSSSAEATFSEVCDSYVRIFTRLGLPFVQGVVSVISVIYDNVGMSS